jgi:hypothetical protein
VYAVKELMILSPKKNKKGIMKAPIGWLKKWLINLVI